DGIRDPLVTGVQTCALPISDDWSALQPFQQPQSCRLDMLAHLVSLVSVVSGKTYRGSAAVCRQGGSSERRQRVFELGSPGAVVRSEERRVGKERRCRVSGGM